MYTLLYTIYNNNDMHAYYTRHKLEFREYTHVFIGGNIGNKRSTNASRCILF